MTRNNLLVGAGVAVGLIVLAVFLFNALDTPPPEASPTSTTIVSDETLTTSTTLPSTTSTTFSTTSTTISITTSTTEGSSGGFPSGGGDGEGGGNGGGGGGTSSTSTTTTTMPTTTTSAPTTTTTTAPTTTTPTIPPVVNVPPVADDETAGTDEDNPVDDLAVLPGDTDTDGDTLDVIAVGTTSAGGTAVLNADNTVDFIPGPLFQDLQVGTQRVSSFSYTVSDGQGGTDAGLVSITVTGLNDAPVAVDDTATTSEGTPLVVAAASGVLGNDTDPDAADTLTVTTFSGTLSSGAPFTLAADGAYTHDPSGIAGLEALDGGETIVDDFTYTVTDSQGAIDTGLLSVTVTGVNDAPVLDPASGTVDENAANGTVVTTVTSSDVEGNTVTYSITAGNTGGAFAIDPSSGEITVASSAVVDFETNPSFTLTMQATDDGTPNQSDNVDVVITVVDVNEAPIVDADIFTVADDSGPGTAVGTVTFTDPDAGQTQNFAITAGNTGGAFALDPATGAITLAAPVDFETTPSYSLTVEVTDDGTPALTGSATITVNVANVNEAPSITAPAFMSAVRDVPVVVGGISVADPDAGDIELTLAVDDGALTVDPGVIGPFTTIVGNETSTVVVTATVAEINAALSDPNGLTYLNDTGFVGATDTLSLDIDDLGTPPLTASATVTIQFNQIPVAADLSLNTNEDTPLVVTLSATDADDDDLTFAIVTGPANGSLSAIGAVDCTMTVNTCTSDVTYTPTGHFNGSDQFTYSADDGPNTDTGTVSITVNPLNDAPVITLSGSAPSFTEGSAGVAVDDGLTVTDIDDADLVSGTVSITAGLVAGDTLFFTPAGGIVDIDPAPGVLALTGTTTLANWQTTMRSVQFGTLNDNPTAATRTVSFTVNDGDVSSATVTKDVAVVPVNDAPVLTQPDATAVTYIENAAPTVIAPNITASDVDSTNLVGATITIGTGFVSGQDVLSLGINPQNGITAAAFNATTGTLTLSGTSTVANYQIALRDLRYSNSSDDPITSPRTISFQVDDGPGPSDLSNIVTRDVTVTAVNDPPTAPVHTYAATANMAVDIPAATGLLAGATDPEAGTTLTVGTVSATTPAGGAITNLDTATGAFRFNPPPGVTGPVTFTYTVCDNGNPAPPACSAPATVTVNVAGPVIWFVNGSATAGGTGRLTDPFQTITAASTAIGANTNQRVFAYAGTYTGQGIALNNGGWLIGQQVTGTSFDTVMAITPATGTIGRPAIATGTAGLGNTVTLNTNNVLRGIAINSGANTALTGSGGLTGVDVTQTTTNTTTGTALSLNNVAGALSFTNVFKSSSGTGISLTNVGANVTIAAGGISATVAGVDIDGGTGSFSMAGSISNSAGRTVEVTNRNTGSPGLIQFTGGVTGNGASTGVNLDNNDNGTVTFAGGLVLNTGANPAYTAINGGTVTVTDPNGPAFLPNNTLTTTTGNALNVTGTTIGAAGLNFLSISANGAANGILLNNAGTSGRLVVSGDLDGNPDGGGGTIQNTTSHGISLTGTILGPTLTDMSVINAGNGDNEYGLFLSNVSGTTALDDATFNGAADNLIYLSNLNVNATFNVTGSLFSYPTTIGGTANSAILIEPGGTSSITASVTGSTFTDIVSASTQIGANTLGANGALSLTFTGNTVNSVLSGRAGGVVVSGQENTTTSLTIGTPAAPNTFNGAGGNGVVSIDINDSSIVTGTIANNTINNPPGIGIFSAVDEGATSTLTFNANTVTNSGGDGFQLVNFGGAGTSTMNATVTNNVVNGHSLNTAVSFVGGISATGFEDVIDLQLTGNSVIGTPTGATQCGGAPCVDYYLEEVGGTYRLEEIPDVGADLIATAAFVNAKNDAGPVTIFGTIDLSNGVEISSS